jgi:transglutaminase-like putative cysteine protease
VPTNPARRRVGCELSFEIVVPSRLALHVAVAQTGDVTEERFRLSASTDGNDPVAITAEHGGRIQLVGARPGRLDVSYSAVVGPGDLAGANAAGAAPGGDQLGIEQLVALRQSRYCPSDQLAGFAAANFGHLSGPGERARAVASWVFERLAYEPGVSRSTDTAIDTLLGGRGVCRDFAHLTIALCRAVGVPARLASVYAPGLSPMDFHAVTEVWGADGWEILDATRLAPRSSLVRIATGRDAADTAFATVVEGDVRYLASTVFAVVDGDLPGDDHVARVALA